MAFTSDVAERQPQGSGERQKPLYEAAAPDHAGSHAFPALQNSKKFPSLQAGTRRTLDAHDFQCSATQEIKPCCFTAGGWGVAFAAATTVARNLKMPWRRCIPNGQPCRPESPFYRRFATDLKAG